MKYLGIDYGKKRIGIAVSDQEGRIAFPRKTILNRGAQRFSAELKNIIRDESVSKIIVGLPLALAGNETEESGEVRKFVSELSREINLPLEFENEMLTSHLAEVHGVAKEHTDESAAALILQSYLDKESSKFKNQNSK